MEYDDWLFDSIRRYDRLSMFDIKHTVTAADWVDGSGLLVATETSFPGKFELMELHLPDKITDEENSLKKGCDFHVHSGGFSSSRIDCLRHIPSTRSCIVSTRANPSIQLWELGDDTTNLIKPVPDRCVCPSSYNTDDSHTGMAGSYQISNVSGQSVAFGHLADRVVIADVEKFQRTQEILLTDMPAGQKNKISDLFMIDSSTLLCCVSNGNLFKYDLRNPKRTTSIWKTRNNNTFWRMTNMGSDKQLLLGSTEYDIFCVSAEDFENWTQLLIRNSDKTLTDFASAQQFCIQCKDDGKQFSWSGCNGNVYVFNVPESRGFQMCQAMEPEFVHDGHVMNSSSQSEDISVVKHMWLPGKRIIVSMAIDGSLHAWQHRPHFSA